ncbi:MAG: TetR/AcrR family transcriptional regulator [Ornithinimicrobium sp.]
MPTRAPAMKPDQRRAHLESATVTVLRRRGMAATTKEIAAEAGVAEGTIFRVFDSKDQLIQSALVTTFDPAPLLGRLADIDAHAPLRERLIAMVTAHQDHLSELFGLMAAVGMVRPPESLHEHGHEVHGAAQSRVHDAMLALIEPDAGDLTIPPHDLLRLLRMLTFAGSHKHIAHGDLLTPRQIVDVLLDGTLAPGSTPPRRTATTPC